MSWYEFLLFVHIAMATIWVGGAAMMPSWGDGSLWIAVLVFAALAALLVRNGMNARLSAASAPE
jgi:hypothetical protein